jgi:Zn ribbon nucleic-acid-binding protein
MQHCNMFQTCILKENFNKVLMQCSHSKHANIIQMWGNNYNKTKLECIRCKYHIYQNFRKCPKKETMNSMPLFMPKKTKQDMHVTF